MVRRLVGAAVVAAILVAVTPSEGEAVADLYRDIAACDVGEGELICHTYTIWTTGFIGNIACHAATKGTAWFTWGYTWIIGSFYCGVLGGI